MNRVTYLDVVPSACRSPSLMQNASKAPVSASVCTAALALKEASRRNNAVSEHVLNLGDSSESSRYFTRKHFSIELGSRLFTELAEKRPEEYRAHVTPNLVLDLLSSSVYTSGDKGDLVRLVAEMIRLLKAASLVEVTEQLRSVYNVTRNKVRGDVFWESG